MGPSFKKNYFMVCFMTSSSKLYLFFQFSAIFGADVCIHSTKEIKFGERFALTSDY